MFPFKWQRADVLNSSGEYTKKSCAVLLLDNLSEDEHLRTAEHIKYAYTEIFVMCLAILVLIC